MTPLRRFVRHQGSDLVTQKVERKWVQFALIILLWPSLGSPLQVSNNEFHPESKPPKDGLDESIQRDIFKKRRATMGEVHSMAIWKVKPYQALKLKGHKFLLMIELTDIDDCELKWFERTNLPYVDQGTWQPGVWKDMFSLADSSNVFRPWQNAESKEGYQVIAIWDPPATSSENRVLDFCIACHNEHNGGYVLQCQQVVGTLWNKSGHIVSDDAYTFRMDPSKDSSLVDIEHVLGGAKPFRYFHPFGPDMPWQE